MTSLGQKASLIILGVFLTFLILEIILQISGAVILTTQEYKNRTAFESSSQYKNSYRILCIGESTTQGQYPPFLEKILNSQNIGIHFIVIDQGIGATNTSIILSQLEKNLETYQPNMVLAMIGVNDWSIHLPPQELPSSSRFINFIRDLKCYKLLRLIKLHIFYKFYSHQNLEHPYIKSPYQTHLEMGETYVAEGKIDSAKTEFEKAISIDPFITKTYFNLMWIDWQNQKKIISRIQNLLKNAIKANPNDNKAIDNYIELGARLTNMTSYPAAERILNKSILLRPQNYLTYISLGKCYFKENKIDLAKKAYETALALNPNDRKAYDCLASLYHDIRNDELAKKFSDKANEAYPLQLYPSTIQNYLTIKKILDKHKIQLVCIQYPLRPIALLKKLFPRQNVLFVDNEYIFKTALAKSSYNDYFKDMSAGDFGHCTDKGNKLLAENIAQMILNEIYNHHINYNQSR